MDLSRDYGTDYSNVPCDDAFSETLFVLFITLSLIVIDKFLNEDKRSLLIWAAVWAALACLTRYVGVTLVFASVLLLAVDRSAELLQRAKRVTVYSLDR